MGVTSGTSGGGIVGIGGFRMGRRRGRVVGWVVWVSRRTPGCRGGCGGTHGDGHADNDGAAERVAFRCSVADDRRADDAEDGRS